MALTGAGSKARTAAIRLRQPGSHSLMSLLLTSVGESPCQMDFQTGTARAIYRVHPRVCALADAPALMPTARFGSGSADLRNWSNNSDASLRTRVLRAELHLPPKTLLRIYPAVDLPSRTPISSFCLIAARLQRQRRQLCGMLVAIEYAFL